MPKGSKAKTKLGRSELAIALTILTLSIAGLVFSTHSQSPIVIIDEARFEVQLADTVAERRQGLSGQDALENDEGMLFVFEEKGKHGFWMKDMKFSIDIIWIDENLTVIHLEEGVSPDTFPESFAPSVDAHYVLEVYTGQAEAQGIDLGDRVTLDI